MYYEFFHDRNNPLLEQIAHLSGEDTYFLICLGMLNYLHSSDVETMQKIRRLIASKNIYLHTMTEEEMREIIDSEDTKKLQRLYGSVELFNRFCVRYQTS